jgi:hypothetical protein
MCTWEFDWDNNDRGGNSSGPQFLQNPNSKNTEGVSTTNDEGKKKGHTRQSRVLGVNHRLERWKVSVFEWLLFIV